MNKLKLSEIIKHNSTPALKGYKRNCKWYHDTTSTWYHDNDNYSQYNATQFSYNILNHYTDKECIQNLDIDISNVEIINLAVDCFNNNNKKRKLR